MTLQSRFQQAMQIHQQGDLERARSGYLAILERHPRHSDALHLLGVCAFQSGHADEAITHINSAIAQAPGVADYHNNLGEVLRHCAHMDAAEKAYRRALEINPDYADAHNNLALVLQSRGKLDQAIEHLRRAQTIDPQSPQSAANLANALRLAGDHPGARDSFRRALVLAPEFSEARLTLCQLLIDSAQVADALSLAEEGSQLDAQDPAVLCARACVALALTQYTEAANLIRLTADLNPQSGPVQMTLGRLLLNLGENTQALWWLEQAARQIPTEAQLQSLISQACLELNRLAQAHEAICKALELEPENQDFQVQRARGYRYQDRLADAAHCLATVLAVQPAHLSATVELSEVHLLAGEADKARELLEQILIREPENQGVRERLASVLLSAGDIQASTEILLRIIADDPGRITSYQLLSQAKRFEAVDESILAALARQLETREPAPPLAAVGHFALGKMLADRGRYAQGFEHFQLANQLRRKQLDYHPRDHEAFVRERIQAFDHPRLERLTRYGNTSRVPIIIAGMPRSGTTLVERILAGHPQVMAGGEIDTLTRIHPRPLGVAPAGHYLGQALDTLDAGTVERLSKDYLTRLRRDHPTAERITDKTPQNFLHLGMAAILFPKIPLVHCCRHPLATCMSIYSMDMNLGNEFGYQLDEMAHYYGQYQRIMQHWHGLIPGRIFDLSYERLVTDFETVCRELLAFCGLEWDPRCLDFHTTTTPVLTASDWQVRQPLYTGAVNAWRHYESELEPLRRALAEHGVALN